MSLSKLNKWLTRKLSGFIIERNDEFYNDCLSGTSYKEFLGLVLAFHWVKCDGDNNYWSLHKLGLFKNVDDAEEDVESMI